MSKIGLVVTVIGEMGEGKSPWVKNMVRSCDILRKCVNDVRYEYTGEKYPQDDLDKSGNPIFIYFHNFDAFKTIVFEEPGKQGTGIDKAVIIFEEATIYGGRISDEDFRRFVFGAQHRNLVIFLCYHSVKDTPEFLIRHSDIIALFETGENPDAWRDDRALLKPYAPFRKRKQALLINKEEMLKYKPAA